VVIVCFWYAFQEVGRRLFLMEGAVEYLNDANWPWIMVKVEPCSVAGMPKRSVLFAIKLARLAQGDEHTYVI